MSVMLMSEDKLLSIKIRADVYRMAKTIAAWEGEHISDLVSDTLRPILQSKLKQVGQSPPPDSKKKRDTSN